MGKLATFNLENILESDGITKMTFWENRGIFTVTAGNKLPNFDPDEYGCESIEDLKILANRSLKRITDESKKEVLNYLNTL